jgi:hypothetical protein
MYLVVKGKFSSNIRNKAKMKTLVILKLKMEKGTPYKSLFSL